MARKFGIEIEFMYDSRRSGWGSNDTPDAMRLLAELRNQGLRVMDRRTTHLGSSSTEWVLKRDGSVGGGGELVSPHLDFDNTDHREQVNKAFDALIAAGCNADDRAGVHVHVECADFTPKQLAAVARFTYKFEDAIFRIASSGWTRLRSLQWCAPLPENVAHLAMRIRTAEDLNRDWYRNGSFSRYHMLNIHAWFRHGTLEFRVFNSTMNAKRAQAYIALAVTIVDDARKGYNRQTKTHYPLGWMAMKDEAGEDGSGKLFLRLQQVLRYESEMSVSDWKNILWAWNDSAPQKPEHFGLARLQREARV